MCMLYPKVINFVLTFHHKRENAIEERTAYLLIIKMN